VKRETKHASSFQATDDQGNLHTLDVIGPVCPTWDTKPAGPEAMG
jgi:hypothetical protein